MKHTPIELPIPLPSELVSDAPAFQQERTYISIIDSTLAELEKQSRPRSKSITEQWYGSLYDVGDLRSFLENKGSVFTKKS